MNSFLAINIELLGGFITSLKLFCYTLVFSLPIGFIICYLSTSKIKIVSLLSKLFVWIIRGTPLLLQVLIIFFAPGILFGKPIFADKRFLAALVTFVINYAAYFSEIYRGGFEAIDEGQWEAGKVLGLSKVQTLFNVVIMQVVKRILPAISNEVITLVKDTSLVRVISVIEIIKVAERYTSKGLIWPLFYTGVFYLAFCGLLSLLFNYLEKRLDYYKG